MSVAVDQYHGQQKRYLAGVLELLCQQLELTPSQYEDATAKYEAVGNWLNEGVSLTRWDPEVFPQGSIRLGTTVRPLSRDEFDVDLVCWLARGHDRLEPSLVMKLIGDRLRENKTYRDMLEPKNRCWRLNYAGEFHMDVTPAVANSRCSNGGLVVPDRQLHHWSATNPIGYAKWFEEHAVVQPRLMHETRLEVRAGVAPLPDQIPFKNILIRVVQLLKRHRDVRFHGADAGLAPISIIVTTLAAQSYVTAIAARTYATEIDLLLEVIQGMPAHIEVRSVSGAKFFLVPNPTTLGENFADKWNQNPVLAEAFFDWHTAALGDLHALLQNAGLDSLRRHLSERFGEWETGRTVRSISDATRAARDASRLRVTAATGLTTATGGVGVQAHNFYGSQG